VSLAVSVSRAFFWNHANKVVGFFLDFVLSIILARGLGTYVYGVYSELINVTVFFSLICSLGLDTALNVFIPKYRNDQAKLSALIKKTFVVFTLIAVMVCLSIFFLGQLIGEVINSPEIKNHLIFVSSYIFFYTFIIIAQSILLSLFDTKFLFFANTLYKLMIIAASFFLVRFGFNLREIFIAFIVSSIVVSIAYLINFQSFFRAKKVIIDTYDYFKFGIIILLTKFLNYILGRYFDIFLLGYFNVEKEQIGFYNIAFSTILALSFMFTSGFTGIALSAFSDLAMKKNYLGIARGWITLTKISIFFCLPIFLFVLIDAKSILALAYSNAYIDSARLLQVFGGLFLVSILIGSGANSTVLYSVKKEKSVLTLRAIIGLVNIVLDIMLIPHYKALGAVIATGISTVLIIFSEYILLKKEIDINYPWTFLLKMCGASVLAMSPIVLVPVPGLFGLMLKLFISILIFTSIIFVLKPFTSEDYGMTEKVFGANVKYLKPFIQYEADKIKSVKNE